MYISRAEAGQRLKVTEGRLRQLEKKGKLVPIRASDVDYTPKKNENGGGEVKWVYEEAQVAALVGKAGADARFAREHRRDALVFDMLAEGKSVVAIVRKLRLDLPTVKRLREEFVHEDGGFVVLGEDVRAAKELGFELTSSKSIITILTRVHEFLRGAKPSNDKLSRLKVVPDK